MTTVLNTLCQLPNTLIIQPTRAVGNRIYSVAHTAYGYVPDVTFKRVLALSAAVSMVAMAVLNNPLYMTGFALSMTLYAIHDEYSTRQQRLREEEELRLAGFQPTKDDTIHGLKLECASLRSQLATADEEKTNQTQATKTEFFGLRERIRIIESGVPVAPTETKVKQLEDAILGLQVQLRHEQEDKEAINIERTAAIAAYNEIVAKLAATHAKKVELKSQLVQSKALLQAGASTPGKGSTPAGTPKC